MHARIKSSNLRFLLYFFNFGVFADLCCPVWNDAYTLRLEIFPFISYSVLRIRSPRTVFEAHSI